MVDIDSVLQGVQERDNWRRRLDLLERSLREVQSRKRRLEGRLRRVRKELARLPLVAEAVAEVSLPHHRPIEVNSAPRGPLLR
jgi:hypothetical protein